MPKSKRSKSLSKKRRSKSKSKDELKRPMNSFMLYAKDVREENEKEGGDPITNKEIGKRWKKLSLSKKKEYQILYDKNKIAFEKEMKSTHIESDDDDDEDQQYKNKKSKKKTKKSKNNKNSKKKCDCGKCSACRGC